MPIANYVSVGHNLIAISAFGWFYAKSNKKRFEAVLGFFSLL